MGTAPGQFTLPGAFPPPGAGLCPRRTGPCAGALSGAHPGGQCFAGQVNSYFWLINL